jgi:hypothetical protein
MLLYNHANSPNSSAAPSKAACLHFQILVYFLSKLFWLIKISLLREAALREEEDAPETRQEEHLGVADEELAGLLLGLDRPNLEEQRSMVAQSC